QNDALRLQGADLLDGKRIRMDLAVHLGFAHPSSDELRVLTAEVEDENHGRSRGRSVVSSRAKHSTIATPPPSPFQPASGHRTAASIPPVVRWFLGHEHVVHVALFERR